MQPRSCPHADTQRRKFHSEVWQTVSGGHGPLSLWCYCSFGIAISSRLLRTDAVNKQAPIPHEPAIAQTRIRERGRKGSPAIAAFGTRSFYGAFTAQYRHDHLRHQCVPVNPHACTLGESRLKRRTAELMAGNSAGFYIVQASQNANGSGPGKASP